LDDSQARCIGLTAANRFRMTEPKTHREANIAREGLP
jgi:hypothetical protein